MITLAIVLGLNTVERVAGRSEKTTRIISESNEMNQRSRQAMTDIARSTDEILSQTAISGRLLAESMKNENLRRFKSIEKERLRILS